MSPKPHAGCSACGGYHGIYPKRADVSLAPSPLRAPRGRSDPDAAEAPDCLAALDRPSAPDCLAAPAMAAFIRQCLILCDHPQCFACLIVNIADLFEGRKVIELP
ncbi:MAG: hypothetical protein LBJ10_06310 [Clostridiales bacterium]|nr:hypothetical protein [Clostridiales bacterium]